jgi:thiamine biosynthesis lipoprotein
MTSAGKISSHFGRWLFVLFCLSSGLLGCNGGDGMSQLGGRTMGTSWTVSYLPGSDSPSNERLQRGAAAVLVEINASMSTYRPKSEISRLNREQPGEWFDVSASFLEVLQAALTIGTASDGAYDVTVGPLVDRWGFGPGHKLDNVPSDSEIQSLLTNVGQAKLQLDSTRPAVLKTTNLSLDFSSIAKGYAVDRVAEYLKQQHVDNFLVEVGGELRLSGRSGRGDNWRIAIEQPDGGMRDVARTIALTDTAVATSGDYRNFFELNDKRYSHSIDPRTGHPIEHDLVSVTVIHPSAMMADGWATALAVLGSVRAMEVAQEQGLAVYFIRRDGDGFPSSHSEAFEKYLQDAETQE